MNNQQLERIKSTGKINRVAIGGGLSVHVSPDATKKRFVFRYRSPRDGRILNIKIGAFDPTTFTIQDARAAVAKHKATIAAGDDPTPPTKTPRRTAPPPPPTPIGHTKEMTVGELCDRFVTQKTLTCGQRTIANCYLPQINNYIKPPWGAWPVSSLKYGIIKADPSSTNWPFAVTPRRAARSNVSRHCSPTASSSPTTHHRLSHSPTTRSWAARNQARRSTVGRAP